MWFCLHHNNLFVMRHFVWLSCVHKTPLQMWACSLFTSHIFCITIISCSLTLKEKVFLVSIHCVSLFELQLNLYKFHMLNRFYTYLRKTQNTLTYLWKTQNMLTYLYVKIRLNGLLYVDNIFILKYAHTYFGVLW